MQANEQRKKTFTLMILDLDDTLIPTSIRQFLYKNFKIDIFKSLKTTLLKRLQLNIIRALQNIQQQLTQSCNDHLEIALVSNATLKWLKRMLLNDATSNVLNPKKKSKDKEAYFKILHKYFVRNNISIHSSKHENNYKDDAESEKHNLWILKYKSISALIAKKELALKMKCTQIVSFGDGCHEKEALRVYSQAKKIQCIHFEFIKAATITQLNKEWQMLSNANEIDIAALVNMNYFLCNKSKQSKAIMWIQTNYLVYTMNDVLDINNNEECSGKYQLSAISKYFGIWIETVTKIFHLQTLYYKIKNAPKKQQKEKPQLINGNTAKKTTVANTQTVKKEKKVRLKLKLGQKRKSLQSKNNKNTNVPQKRQKVNIPS